MKKIYLVSFPAIVLGMMLFAVAAPAHAQTSDLQTREQLAVLSAYLDSLRSLLSTLQSLFSSGAVLAQTTPPTATITSPANGATPPLPINIYWSGAVSPYYYTLWRSGIAVSGCVDVPYTTTQCMDTNASGTVGYTMVACTGPGASNFSSSSGPCASSNTVSITVGSPPPAPSSVTATSATGKISVTWPSSGAAKYSVWRSTNNGTFQQWAAQITNTYFDDLSVTQGTAYKYWVFGCASDGFTCPLSPTESNSVTYSTADTQAPSTPTGLGASANTNSVSLWWNASTDNIGVVGYKVYRNSVFLASVGSSTLSYSDSGLSSGTTYNYTVAAYDAAGNISPQSAQVSATTTTLTAPAKPSVFTAYASSSDVSLYWEGNYPYPVPESEAKVYRRLQGSSSWILIYSKSYNLAYISYDRYTDAGLANATYEYHINYCNSAGCSVDSNTATVTIGGSTTTTTSGPIGYWKFDGNGNNEISGGSGAVIVGNSSFYSSGGKLGGYLYIPTGADWAKIPYSSTFDLPGPFTIEFWFRQRADRSFLQDLVYKGTPTNNYNFRIFRQLWNQYNFGPVMMGSTAANTGFWHTPSNGNQLSHGSWHHVAFTRNLSETVSYLDGAILSSINFAQYPEYSGPVKTPANDIIIGDSAVDTDIDDLKIYSRSLGASEVSQDFSAAGGGTADTTPPSTPTGLTTSIVSTSQINLSWTASTDNSGVTGYKIYRGGTQIATSTGASYSNTGLSPSTSYTYTVAAYDAAGNNSSQSGSANATTSGGTSSSSTAPNTPSNLSGYASGSSVYLNWQDNSTNESGFEVYKMVNGTWSQLGYLSPNTVSYMDTNFNQGLAAGTYTYYVNSYIYSGGTYIRSPASNNVSVAVGGSTASSTVPNIPYGLNYFLSNSSATVNLSWQDNSTNETRFEISRQYGGVWNYLTQTNANVASFSDNPPTGTYSYYVVACNGVIPGGGCSTASNTIGPITVSANPNKPNAPSNLMASVSGTSVYLAWTDNSTNESGFKMYDGPTRGDMGNVGANVTSYTDPNLAAGTYYYKVQAFVSASGSYPVYSDVSNEVAVTVGGGSSTTPSPTATATASPTPVSTSTAYAYQAYGLTASLFGSNVTMSWINNTTNASLINVMRRPSGSGTAWVSFGSTGPAATTFTDYSVPSGTYDYEVFTCNPSCPPNGSNWATIAVGGYVSTTSTTGYLLPPPTYPTSSVPYIDIKVDGVDGTAYRAAAASYTLSWNTSGATTCTASGTWGGSKSIYGSQYFTGVTVLGTKTYTLTCSNSYGSSSDTVNVEITSAPSIGTTSTYPIYPYPSVTSTSQTAGAFLQGAVRDSLQRPVQGVYVHVWSDGFGLNFSAITDAQGAFGTSLPAGTYFVEASPPSARLDLVKQAPQKMSVASGEVKTISLQFSAAAKVITGTAAFSSGQPITDAEVGAYSSVTNQWTSVFTDGSGKFTLRVAGGVWQVGIRPKDPLAAKWSWSGNFSVVTFASDASAETQTVNFTISLLDTKVTVHVVDQGGAVLANAGIVIDASSAGQAPPPGATLPPPVFRKSDGSGTASFSLQAGNYFVRAFLPPELGYVNPDEQKISLAVGESKDITLIFRKREAVQTVTLGGTTHLEDGTPTDAFIWAWSERGDTVQVRSNVAGTFSFPVISGRWHVGAGKEFGGFPYKSSELTVDVGESAASVDIVMTKIGKPLAPPVTVSQPATEQVIAQAQDGAKVSLPENAGAVATGNVNITVKPTIEAPSQAAAKVVSTVYDVNIKSDSGTNITSLQKEVEITIPYKDEDLKAQGVTAEKLVPSYYDEAAGTWVKVDNYTIDKEKHVVIARVKHLTRFALIAAADITPPDAPANISAKKGGPGEIVISWINPTGDFDHVKIYRSTVSQELGKLVANNIQGTSVSDTDVTSGTKYFYAVRSVDPAGNESINVDQVAVTSAGVFKAGGLPAQAGLPPGQATKLAILRKLTQGMSGDDVKAMQAILVKEGVYPEGLITGFFGKLTKVAVIRFQEKYADEILKPNGLNSGTGVVGPSTRAKLNKMQ